MGILCHLTRAQTPAGMTDDSSRVVELREVQVASFASTARGRLQRYVRANRNATLEEILARVPEAGLIRRGPYGMEPTLRSYTGGQINVLLDGMRIHGACTDKMDPATIYIEPVNLDQLQVQTGSQGFLQGSSVGGTVNLKMAEPDFNTPHAFTGQVSSGFQTAARAFFESARLQYRQERWALLASGVYRHQQPYRAGGGRRITFSQFEKWNYSLSLKYRLNERQLLKADWLADEGRNIGYPALPMDVGFANARIGALTWELQVPGNAALLIKVKAYANRVRHAMDDTHRPGVIMHMDMPGSSATRGLLAESEWKGKREQLFSLRADVSGTRLKADMTMYAPGQAPMYMLTWPDNRKLQSGLAFGWKVPLDSHWRLQTHLRTDWAQYRLLTQQAKDQVSIFGFPTGQQNFWLKNGGGQLTRVLSRLQTLSLSLAYAERLPTASELYGFYLFNAGDGYDYIGYPLLRPETNRQIELNWQYRKGQQQVQVSAFVHFLKNYIAQQPAMGYSVMTPGARGVKTYRNDERALLAGAEITGLWKPGAAWEGVTVLRYTFGQDHQKNPLPQVAPFRQTHSLRWHDGRFFIQAESDMAAGQKRFNPAAGEDFSSCWWIFHIRMGHSHELGKTRLQWQAGVENLLDRHYHEHLDWGNIPRPGRNFFLQLTVNW